MWSYTTHNLISIIALISIGLTAMSLPLRSSITLSVCFRFLRNLQWYCRPIFTLDLPYLHEYITRSLHSIFNHRKDIVYCRSSSILISVIRISYCKITLNECPFNIQRRIGLGVALVAIFFLNL